MKLYCEHAECRATTKQELGWAYLYLDWPELLRAIKRVDSELVPCRKVPRRGAVDAPFPGQ
jgi:hypothetical protein